MADPDIVIDGSTDLKALIERRHPEYEENLEHWNFCEMSYRGGRKWFDDGGNKDKANLFPFYKEGSEEYEGRKRRAYRANHTKRVLDTIGQYLFRTDPIRSDKAPELLRRFWANVGGGKSADEFAKDIDAWMGVFGRIYIVVDRLPSDAATETRRRTDETLPYAYIVFPQRALDFAFGEDGRLLWILISEDKRNVSLANGDIETQYRLWTRKGWYLIGLENKENNESLAVIDKGEHNLGVVPVIPVGGDNGAKWSAPALISDIVYMDRALVNYGSMLDEIIYEQTFSQMTLPVEAIPAGAADKNALISAAKNRIFLYNSAAPGLKPEFISPDASQARVILEAMQQIKRDIYAVTGTDNDANSQSMSTGKSYASGKVRQFDHTQIENILLNKARAVEAAEEAMAALVFAWMGEKEREIDPEWIVYPDKFDIRGLVTELEIAAQLTEIEAPVGMLRLQMKTIAEKTFPRLSDEEREALNAEIDAWEPGFTKERAAQKEELDIKRFTAESQADAMDDDDIPGNNKMPR